ncbi:NADP oxidoreductase coenzyme F420-dependent [Streptomyces jumonjinensis]|uniref:NADP oxidoreductase coenzyme F420-dependent n=1 Tax=Streptomyces jumonjinensis TaxID=1945 RepID=A0A646KA21_STRJU|nr:NADP oxidoreductase coenzyme F420-dependent [Streptomyces jumonjinensis]
MALDGSLPLPSGDDIVTTAIVGLGAIGSRLASGLADGGEPLLLAGRDIEKAQELAGRLGERATAVSTDDAVERADILILSVWFDTIKELIAHYGDRLNGTIVVDPSNPIAPDGKGGFTKTIPKNESSGTVIAGLLPPGARPVKAFGTLMADSLTTAAHRTPHRAVGFYAADDTEAGDAVAGLIRTAGFDPVRVGGIDQSLRIEVFGDLHEGTLGTIPTAEEARSLL